MVFFGVSVSDIRESSIGDAFQFFTFLFIFYSSYIAILPARMGGKMAPVIVGKLLLLHGVSSGVYPDFGLYHCH